MQHGATHHGEGEHAARVPEGGETP
jgi:hypothetical protein